MTNTQREQKRRWRMRNPDKVRAQKRRTRLNRSGKDAAYLARWRKAHPELVKASREKEKVRYRAYNAHYSRLKKLRRRLATIGDLTDIFKVYDRCAELRQWFKGLVVDHIVPLSRGGTHEAKNLQIIYDFENQRKYNKPDYKPKVIFA
jgi:5-methylcytosine-specific restriction endonuclease McrA